MRLAMGFSVEQSPIGTCSRLDLYNGRIYGFMMELETNSLVYLIHKY
jgi:hypothetical protein